MPEVRFYNAEQFGELENDWKNLQSGQDMTVFQQYIWYYGLNQQYIKGCFKSGEQAVYAVAIEDGKSKMIAPLHIKKFGWEYKGIGTDSGVYIIGTWGFTDYLNFIYSDFSEECFEAILAAVKSKYKIKKFHFNFIRQGTETDKYLIKNYGDKKTSETICVQTLPHESFDDFHKTMTKYSRQNIRKAFNRENKTEMEIHIQEFGQVSQTEADEFFNIYLERSGYKNELNIKEDGLKQTVLKYFNKKYNDNLKNGLAKFNYITYNMVNNPESYMIGIFNGDKKIGFIYGIMEGKNMWRNIIVCFDEE